ncbi:MAG: hypothetical protein OMM_06415 [Candidatus Magnetoglobus multicellularis str. Araruama]|uniref:Uncharacterized protein n=1 Tax=Candidatus Magnetoglobus multicellularis str. Araruama TaxID=890399 RepID=A0A1V1PHW2_9BACT|nr:MAG: hypothetical protein OMM_06415 [Candidatus Magnetoglobus multicellularis str. Araruama]
MYYKITSYCVYIIKNIVHTQVEGSPFFIRKTLAQILLGGRTFSVARTFSTRKLIALAHILPQYSYGLFIHCNNQLQINLQQEKSYNHKKLFNART